MGTTETLLMQAATLTVTGMGVVFIFLTILVYLVRLTSRYVISLEPSSPPTHNTVPSEASQTVHPKVVAAITAAIQQHRVIQQQ